MNINEKVDQLYNQLLPQFQYYINEYSLESIYNFEVKSEIFNSDLFSKNEILAINKITNLFEKNDYLKILISQKILDSEYKLNYYDWIVKKWGKIKNKKSVEPIKYKKLIEEFYNQLKNDKLRSIYYNGISSYSKIASFEYLEKYFIYDSRVAYVLNWMLIKTNEFESFFPIPDGRNTDLAKYYNMNTIISLLNNSKYLDKKYTYVLYCKLIIKIYKQLNLSKPYYVEMLLWAIFDEIIEEIKCNVKIVIKK